MKKLVLKINMPDEEAKRKALKTVAAFQGIDSISVDIKDRKMVIIGTVDPTRVVSRLRKYWTTELLTVGPAKEPEVKKLEEPKKDEGASGGDKKPAGDQEGGKREENDKKQPVAEEAKKEEGKERKEGDQGEVAAVAKLTNGDQVAAAEKKVEVEEKKVDPVLEMVRAYRAYNPHMTKYYYVQSMEENPNACVIC